MRQVKLFLGLLLFLGLNQAIGQRLDQSAGLRIGATSAITYKEYYRNGKAVELLLSGRYDGVQIGALYMQHVPLQFTFDDRFYAYYGVGAHMGTERYLHSARYYNNQGEVRYAFSNKRYFAIGLDGIVGVEYRFRDMPLSASLDIKPYMNLLGFEHTRGQFWDMALGVKYRF